MDFVVRPKTYDRWSLPAVEFKFESGESKQRKRKELEQVRSSSAPNDWCFLGFVTVCRCAVLPCHFTFHCWKPREFSYLSHSWFANQRNERVGLLRCVHIVHRTRKGWTRYQLRLLIWDFVILCYYAVDSFVVWTFFTFDI